MPVYKEECHQVHDEECSLEFEEQCDTMYTSKCEKHGNINIFLEIWIWTRQLSLVCTYTQFGAVRMILMDV